MFRSIAIPLIKRAPCFAVRSYRRDGNRKPRDMAGVRIQQGILNNEDALEEDPEISYDADFSNLGASHREYETEMAAKREQVKYHIVKRKYFKAENQPNFLTWAEKEQIRYLHKQEPQEWTSERLAESFPAVEEVIKKILKSKWSMRNMQKIQKHDESVKKNWELLKAKKLTDLDPVLREHLKKFSNRKFDSAQNAYIQTNNDQIQFQFPKPKTKEFSSIISSCKGAKADSKQQTIAQNQNKQIHSNQVAGRPLITGERSQVSQIKLKRDMLRQNMTYDELMKKSGHTIASTEEEVHLSISLPNEEPRQETEELKRDETSLPVEESLVANSDAELSVLRTSNTLDHAGNDSEANSADALNDNKTISLTLADITPEKFVKKYMTKDVSTLKFSAENPSLFRHKINIPDRVRKRGSVYKLNDCFYDDRGMFMYRVPGLVD